MLNQGVAGLIAEPVDQVEHAIWHPGCSEDLGPETR